MLQRLIICRIVIIIIIEKRSCICAVHRIQ